MDMVVAIDHTSGVTSAICLSEAVHKKQIAFTITSVATANVVSLHFHREAFDVVVGPILEEVDKIARL